MAEIYGIDVSKYQNEVNWKKVKAAGKDFVFVRLGWAGWEGEINQDSMAAEHIKGAKEAGLNVGIYVYSYCKTPGAARIAARDTAKRLAQFLPLEYPVAFDIEDTSLNGAPYHTMGKTLNSAIAAAYLDELEKAGFYSMLYTYKSFAENYLDMQSLNRYDVWIAHYAAKCGYNGSFGIWQYAGNDGRCDGVTGPCDLNVAYNDYAALIKEKNLNGYTASSTTSGEPEASLSETERLRLEISRLSGKLEQIMNIAREAIG